MRMNVLLPVIALLSFCSPALAAKKPPEDGSAPTKVHKSGSQSAVSAKHRALRNARYRRHHGGSGGGFDPETGDGADFCGSMAMPATQLREISRGFSSYHAGIDLMAPKGSPIRAAAAGTVIYAGWYFAYGNIVDIQHADGVVTRYAHMTGFAPGIQAGEPVPADGIIGTVGATGRAHGTHVHFEVRINGRPVNPAAYLGLAGCSPQSRPEPLQEARAPEPK